MAIEIIIRDEKSLNNIRNCIINNPLNWDKDEENQERKKNWNNWIFLYCNIQVHNTYFLIIWLENYTFSYGKIGKSVGRMLSTKKRGRKIENRKNRYCVPILGCYYIILMMISHKIFSDIIKAKYQSSNAKWNPND